MIGYSPTPRIWALLLSLLAALITADGARAQSGDFPRDKGLPVLVNVGLAFIEILGFDENAGTFQATVDLQVGWEDSRLAKTDMPATTPPETLRDAAAEARMRSIWVPPVVLSNQVGNASFSAYGLRIFADGQAELLHRVTATFTTDVDVARFPFDQQKLKVEAAMRGLTSAQAILRFDQSDIDFSRAARDASLTGWSVELVDLQASPIAGWYNSFEDRVVATLSLKRQPGLMVASIFIPLFASLLIPLLAIWLNFMEDGIFQVETHEMVNIIIGGLFTVIALNFTVYSSYVVLSVGDNTVNRLFALNYVTLATALMINILFARFNLLARLFHPYVQEQAYYLIMWAIPLAALSVAVSLMLTAYV